MTTGSRWTTRAVATISIAAAAAGLAACGSKQQQQQDPVSMAMQTPGLRMVVIPKQRRDLTVAIPPCSQAQTAAAQGSAQIPPGSNQIVVPKGALTESAPCSRARRPARPRPAAA